MRKKLFDPDQTVRHMSYRDARQKFDRDMQRSILFFRIILVTIIAITALGVVVMRLFFLGG